MSKKIVKYPIPEICIYCGAHVVYTSNEAIYGRKYGNGMCYLCTGCDAFVGVHTGTRIPLGRLANKTLRKLKMQCHALFDVVWKESKLTRSEAYKRLANILEIPHKECHFGWFDEGMLRKAILLMGNPDWYKA